MGVYFSQTSVICFCRGLRYCPFYRGVRYYSRVSARRELTVLRRNLSATIAIYETTILEIKATIELPFRPSLTTLVVRKRQRNMPKGVLHIRQFSFCLTKPVLFSLPRFFRRCRGCTNSVVALSRKNFLCNRISLKNQRFDGNARRKRRAQVPIEWLTCMCD